MINFYNRFGLRRNQPCSRVWKKLLQLDLILIHKIQELKKYIDRNKEFSKMKFQTKYLQLTSNFPDLKAVKILL